MTPYKSLQLQIGKQEYLHFRGSGSESEPSAGDMEITYTRNDSFITTNCVMPC